MASIYEKIKYDHKPYSQLTDPAGKQAIERVAALPSSLETEIVNDPDGRIAIDKSGYFYIDGFQPEIAKKITSMLMEGKGE